MKNTTKLFIAAAFLSVGMASAQSGVGVGTTSPDASAALDVTSTTKGFLMPRMTTAQRTAIVTTATSNGLQVFDTDTKSVWFFDATVLPAPGKWVESSSSINSKWIDGATAGDIVLNNPTGKHDIKYTDNGFLQQEKAADAFDLQTYNVSTLAWDVSPISGINSPNIHRTLTKYIPTNNAASPTRSGFTFHTLAGTSDNSPANTNLFGADLFAVTDKNYTGTGIAALTGANINARHFGTGNISGQVRGAYIDAVVYPSSTAGLVRGAQILGSTYSAGTSSEVTGLNTLSLFRGTGAITSLYGIRNQVIGIKLSATSPDITSNIGNLFGIRTDVSTAATTTGTITNYYGMHMVSTINAATPITNGYGIKIENMPAHISGNNYSVYTGTGKVFFADFTGLNSLTPLSRLSVNGNAAIGTYANTSAAPTDGLIVSGNVGLGTSTPTEKLSIDGNIELLTNDIVTFKNATAANGRVGFVGTGSSTRNAMMISADPDNLLGNTDIAFMVDGASSMNVSASRVTILPTSGNVIIGAATTPTEKLEVNGAIKIGANSGFTPVAGTIRWNASTSKFQGYDGTTWVDFH